MKPKMTFGKTLIIQASPGIGDMIWHLPYLRAIAEHTEGNELSLFTKSRNLTKEWLSHDPIIDEIYYAERRGLFSQTQLLKKHNFDTVWVLHRSFSYAFVAALAGIKNRYGFGHGLQKYLLNKGEILEESMRHWHTIDQVQKLVEVNNLSHDPGDQTIYLPESVLLEAQKYLPQNEPCIALGIGGSGDDKRWSLDNFVNLTLALNSKGYKNLFICGGPGEEEEATQIVEKIAQKDGEATKITTLPIDQSIAFMGACDLYIGNDSGMLNAAVCRGTPAIGLFGPTPVLSYSPLIHGIKEDSMEAISVEAVMSYFSENFGLLRNKGEASQKGKV